MPTPIEYLRLAGIASMTASRKPRTTRTVMMMPSHRMTPMAPSIERPWAVRPYRHRGVEAEAGSHCYRIVGEDPHGNRQDPRYQRRTSCHCSTVEPRITEDSGIDEQDVHHHQERGDTGSDLGSYRGSTL